MMCAADIILPYKEKKSGKASFDALRQHYTYDRQVSQSILLFLV